MKSKAFLLIGKTCIIVTILFAAYGLLIQFVFSYFNQSEYAPGLSFLGFAAPMLITLIIVFVTGLFVFSKSTATGITLNRLFAILLIMCLLLLAGWQVWYVVTLYKSLMNERLTGKLIELAPMIVGLLATLRIAVKAIMQSKNRLHKIKTV